MLKRLLLITTLLAAFLNSALAVDAVTFSYAQGEPSNLRAGLIGAQWNWPDSYAFGDGWLLSGILDAQLGYWSGNSPSNTSITTLTSIPMIRLQKDIHYKTIIPYIDGGVGLAFYTHDQIANHELGAAWGFENKVGAGFFFGENQKYDLSYHYVYFSNYGLYSPNDGMTADWMITFAYHF